MTVATQSGGHGVSETNDFHSHRRMIGDVVSEGFFMADRLDFSGSLHGAIVDTVRQIEQVTTRGPTHRDLQCRRSQSQQITDPTHADALQFRKRHRSDSPQGLNR